MKKGRILVVGLMGLLLVFGMTVVGCDLFDSSPSTGTSGGNSGGNWDDWDDDYGGGSKPTAPVITIAKGSTTGDRVNVVVTWYSVSGATKYDAEYSLNDSYWYTDYSYSDTSKTNYTSTGHSKGQTVYFRVRAGNSNGWSSWSSTRSLSL